MKYTSVGKIVSTHGIKGEVKIKSSSSFKNKRFKVGAKLYVNMNNDVYEELIVNSYRVHKEYDLLTFKGISDINDVLKYMGQIVYSESTRKVLEKDEYFTDDFTDIEVYQNNELVGTCNEVINLPQADYLVVISKDKKRSLVPFLNEFIIDFDLENKKIEIVDMEGLILK